LNFILVKISSCSSLHILLYHIATLVLYSFSLMFLHSCVTFACWALTNFIFRGMCIVISNNEHHRDALFLNFILVRNLFLHILVFSYNMMPCWLILYNFLWCCYIDMFVLLVGHWRIWHSEDRASEYILIIKALFFKIILVKKSRSSLPK